MVSGRSGHRAGRSGHRAGSSRRCGLWATHRFARMPRGGGRRRGGNRLGCLEYFGALGTEALNLSILGASLYGVPALGREKRRPRAAKAVVLCSILVASNTLQPVFALTCATRLRTADPVPSQDMQALVVSACCVSSTRTLRRGGRRSASISPL